MIPFEIKGFPMPPSANALYANGKYGGRFKSIKYREYEETVRLWCRDYQHILRTARNLINNLSHGEVLHVERSFYHQKGKIITKDGKPRKNDTSNRIKALDDVLSEILGTDDSLFWSGTYYKHASTHEALGEYVDIKFSSTQIN